MLLFYGNKFKRAGAAVLAVILSASMLGIGSSGSSRISRDSVIVGGAAEYSAKEKYEKELAQLDREKAELDKKIKAAGDSLENKKEKLAAVEKKAAALKKKIAKQSDKNTDIEDEMCELDAQMRAVRHQVEESEKALNDGLSAYKERLRVIYLAGSDSYSDVLVNAGSFYDMLMRMELMERVAKHDNAFISTLVAENDKLEKSRDDLEKQIKALKSKTGEYAGNRQEIAKEKAELDALVKQYGSEIKSLKKDIEGYNSKAAELSVEYKKVKDEVAAEKAKTSTAAVKTESATTQKTTTESVTTKPDTDKPAETTTTKKKKKTTTTTEKSPEVIVDNERNAPAPETTTTTTTTTTTAAPAPEPEPEYTPEPVYDYSYDDYDSGEDYQEPVPDAIEDSGSDYDYSYDYSDNSSDNSGSSSVSGDVASVIEYAKGMVGGSYVWAGEQYGATDCSGLVMLSYATIGINLPHLASMQAEYGSDVSRSNIQPGDLVFFGYGDYSSIYHVAMYIGDGKIVHAESTDTGIVISNLDDVALYNAITCIKRLV